MTRIASNAGLGFIPLQHEHYDFVMPLARAGRPWVEAFVERLADPATRDALARLRMQP